jgi:hypothetical protein
MNKKPNPKAFIGISSTLNYLPVLDPPSEKISNKIQTDLPLTFISLETLTLIYNQMDGHF